MLTGPGVANAARNAHYEMLFNKDGIVGKYPRSGVFLSRSTAVH